MAWEVVIGSLYVAISGFLAVTFGILLCVKGRSPDDGKINDVQSSDNVPTRGGILFVYGALWPMFSYVFLGVCFLFQVNYGFFQKPRTTDPADMISTPWVQWLFTAIGSVSINYIWAAFFSRFASEGSRDQVGSFESNGAGTTAFRILTVAAGSGGYIFYIFVSIGVDMVTRWVWFGIGTAFILAAVFFPVYVSWNSQWTSAEHLVFWPYLFFTLAHIPLIIVSTDILGLISTEYSQIAYIIVNLVHYGFWAIIAWQVVSTNGMAIALSQKLADKMPLNNSYKMAPIRNGNASSSRKSKKSMDQVDVE